MLGECPHYTQLSHPQGQVSSTCPPGPLHPWVLSSFRLWWVSDHPKAPQIPGETSNHPHLWVHTEPLLSLSNNTMPPGHGLSPTVPPGLPPSQSPAHGRACGRFCGCWG